MYFSFILLDDKDSKFVLVFYIFQLFGYTCFICEFSCRFHYVITNYGKDRSIYKPGLGHIGRDRYVPINWTKGVPGISVSSTLTEHLFADHTSL